VGQGANVKILKQIFSWTGATAFVESDDGKMVPLGKVSDVKIEYPSSGAITPNEARKKLSANEILSRQEDDADRAIDGEDSYAGFPYLPSGDALGANEDWLFNPQQKAPKPPAPILSVGKSKRRIVFED
jgi:hypothetical protein